MNDEQNLKMQEFNAKGFLQLDSFTDGHGLRYVVYHMNPNNPLHFVTGDRFQWQVGLRYDTDINQIVLDFNVEDEVKVKIKSVLRYAH